MFEIISINELLKRLDKYNHTSLHIHHTYSPNHSDWKRKPDALYWQESMRNYHVKTRKFQDIAQHVTLLPTGEFVTGRDFAIDPASITGYNQGAFCVEIFGNFDLGKDKFESKQKESALKLARYFDDKKKYVRFHRENSPKTCPGTSIDKVKFMEEVRSMDYEKALVVLAVTVGIDGSYWFHRKNIDPYFDELIIKIAKYLKKG